MKKILLSIAIVFAALVFAVAPVYADTKCVPTSVLGGSACKDGTFIHEGEPDSSKGEYNCSCDSGDGDSVTRILDLVVDIMSIGIGILGVIGISIVGIQYLTAGGNEEKTRKAKRRMFEIVIGLVVYVLIYAILQFLMPAMK